MKLTRLTARVRDIDLSPCSTSPATADAPVHKPFDRRAFAHLRLTGRALQRRNDRIRLRDAYTCCACKRVTDRCEGQVDHKVPLSRGGSDDDYNLQWLCHPCHDAKTKREQKQ